jgi:hypothetical protein
MEAPASYSTASSSRIPMAFAIRSAVENRLSRPCRNRIMTSGEYPDSSAIAEAVLPDLLIALPVLLRSRYWIVSGLFSGTF